MPEVDGWAVMKRIFNSGSKLPIIFISAENHEDTIGRALQAGAVGFLHKPFEGQTLVDLINVTLENNKGMNKITK